MDRSNFKEKSAAAERREKEAMEAFDVIKNKTEEDAEGKTVVELLEPDVHLTGPCWTAFRKYVLGHPGWDAKRREATDDERYYHHVEKKKGKCYFIDVSFNPKKKEKAEYVPPVPLRKSYRRTKRKFVEDEYDLGDGEEEESSNKEAKTEVEAEGESKTEAEAEGESKTEAEAEGESKTEVEAEGESKTEAVSESKE